MKKFIYSLLSSIILTSLTISSFGQVKGLIYDKETKEPLIGASVAIKGTSKGTITEFDGSFSLEAQKGETLIFSYTGYNDQEVVVDDRETYEIYLGSGVDLNEITVVGSRGKPRTDEFMT